MLWMECYIYLDGMSKWNDVSKWNDIFRILIGHDCFRTNLLRFNIINSPMFIWYSTKEDISAAQIDVCHTLSYCKFFVETYRRAYSSMSTDWYFMNIYIRTWQTNMKHLVYRSRSFYNTEKRNCFQNTLSEYYCN